MESSSAARLLFSTDVKSYLPVTASNLYSNPVRLSLRSARNASAPFFLINSSGSLGWAAVHGRKMNTIKARFEYDNYYVEHLSFGLDFKIFFMTIKAVLTNEGNEDDQSLELKNEKTEQEIGGVK